MMMLLLPVPIRLSLLAVPLLLAALACGPAAPPMPEGSAELPAAQPAAQDDEPTPTPETDRSPKYPNLDDLLQALVQKFEAGELSEEEAAAEAPEQHGVSVLVEVEFEDNPAAAIKVDAWMGVQDISARYIDVEYIPPHIYAYVPFSLLGVLSQQEGVSHVRSDFSPWTDLPAESWAPTRTTRSAEATPTAPPEPRLPFWLKDYPYPPLDGELNRLVYLYEHGELTEAEAASAASMTGHKGSALEVMVVIWPDPAKPDQSDADTDAVVAWLESKGVTPITVTKIDDHRYFDAVRVYVPVSLLGTLSQQPGVVRIGRVQADLSPNMGPRSSLPNSPLIPQSESTVSSSSPGRIVSQGVAVHGADAWHAAGYRGKGIKVGVIDSSFDGFGRLQGTELPSNVAAWCYTSTEDTTPEDNISHCGDHDNKTNYHGTAVSQTVMDMAPEAALYISNASFEIVKDTAQIGPRTKLLEAVDWMIGQGVQVINYSIAWSLTEGPSDGNSQVYHNIFATVDKAVTDNGIIWVNAAGNDAQRMYRNPFRDRNGDQYHEFAQNDDRNYLLNSNGSKTFNAGDLVGVQMRWEDTWDYSDCDMDLHLFSEDAKGNIKAVGLGVMTQNGTYYHTPFEVVSHQATESVKYYLRIKRFKCSNPGWLQLYVYKSDMEHLTGGYSIMSPADSRNPGVLAMGAAPYYSINTIQPYSSRGPTTDGRIKPEIGGADCGEVSYYSEVTPGTNIPNSNSSCWFWGTSQAAPHVAGMAALVKQRFPGYTPAQVVEYLQDTALRRGSPLPNNTWGHGFAFLPVGSLSPAPSNITVGQSVDFTVNTNLPGAEQLKVDVNYSGDSGKLSINSCSSGSDTAYRGDGGTVAIHGCSVGRARVGLYQNDVLLQTYTINVAAATVAPPTNLRLGIDPNDNDELALQYTQSASPHYYQFELYRRNLTTGRYSLADTETDNHPPETFQEVARGYWYQARGRNCLDSARANCGPWSGFSAPLEFSDPAVSISGLASSLESGEKDEFSVYSSDLTLDQLYTVTLDANNSGIGFNSACNQAASANFTANTRSRNVGFTWYACATPGGTVTAKLRKGGSSGTVVDTASYAVKVTETPAASLSPAPTAIKVGQSQTLTLKTNVANVKIAVNYKGNTLTVNGTCPGGWGDHQTRGNGRTITIQACAAGEGVIRLFEVSTGDWLKSYYFRVTETPAASLSPAPSAMKVGQSQTLTLKTNVANVKIAVNYKGNTLTVNGTCPGGWGDHQTRGNGRTITIRACAAGEGVIRLFDSATGDWLKSYYFQVTETPAASLSPAPAAIKVGQSQTFTLKTNVANVKIAVNYKGNTLTVNGTCPGGWGDHQTRGNGRTITIQACAAGEGAIRLFDVSTGDWLKSYYFQVAGG